MSTTPVPTTRRVQQRHLIACVACRRLRTRCIENEDQLTPCLRCRKLGLTCEYTRKKRGRGYDASSKTPRGIEPSSAGHSSSLDEYQSEMAGPSVQIGGEAGFVGRSTYGPIDVREYLNPELPVNGEGSGTVERRSSVRTGVKRSFDAAMIGDDPISMQILTVVEAERLYSLFQSHLVPLVGLLDPQLHTLAYVRSTSTMLFAAILAVAARFFQRPLYQNLHSHAQMILNRATSAGECDIGIIKALIILTNWKTPTDRSSWVKVGTAIRLGYQLRLHVPRTEPLPADETEARLVADMERVWFILSATDRMYADIFSLPTAMPLEDTPDALKWATETRRICPGDMRHACSMSSASVYLQWIRYRSIKKTFSKEWNWSMLKDLYRQYDQHRQYWFPPDPSTGQFSAAEQRVLKWYDINHLFKVKYEMLDVCPAYQAPEVIADCLALANDFTLHTEVMAREGHLMYIQDASASHLSAFGIRMHQLVWRLENFQTRSVIELVKRMYTCCDTAAAGDSEAPTAFVARFMQRLLQAISNESRALSRLPSPLPDEADVDHVNVAAELDMTADLDEFLRTMAPQPTFDQGLDQQFWASLFPNDPFPPLQFT